MDNPKDHSFTDDQLGNILNNPDKSAGYYKDGVYDVNSREGAALHSRGFIDGNGRPKDKMDNDLKNTDNDSNKQESRR